VLPRCRKAEAAIRVPTINDVGRLLGAADECFRAYVALCPFAGLRMGEAAGVQVGDVDFLRRQLTVSRQLQRHGREVAVRAPKYGSERVVYLPDELVTMLAEHVPQHTPEGVPDRWVFTAYGKPLHDNGVTFRWRQTRKAAGCPSVRLHDLRHFYASGLIAAGCDVVTVQRALGHATARPRSGRTRTCGHRPRIGPGPRPPVSRPRPLRTPCGPPRPTRPLTCADLEVQKYQGNGDQSGSRFSRNWSRPSTASSVM
jgi:integrase